MAMRAPRLILAGLMICGLTVPAAARKFKLVKPDEVDVTDIKSLVATATRGCTTDKEKAIALWAYIARRPYYHWGTPREHPEYTSELGLVLDPVANFNVHGQVICFQVVDLLGTMAAVAGIPARTWALQGHCVNELYYDNAWHLFDAQYDCASYHVGADGQTILDHAGVCSNPTQYILNQQNPSDPFYQFDYLGGKFWPWGEKQFVAQNFYGNCSSDEVYATRVSWGHTIQFHLRRGERLTRMFGNTGRWYIPASVYNSWTEPWKNKGPHDPRIPKNRYANGVLVYQPDWQAHENNFLDGLYEGVNYVLADGKVRPAGPGECYVIFRVISPYLIVGKPGRLSLDGDSYGGALFQADFFRANAGAGNSVAISTDNGLTWLNVWTNGQVGAQTVKLDLTNQVEGRYHYLIKVTLAGNAPQDASLANLRLENHLFYSPVPLPAIKPGLNRFKFTCKEQENVLIIRPDLADNPGYQRFFHELHNLVYNSSFTLHLSPSGSVGHATLEVAPPAGSKVQWLTVDGMYSASTYVSNVRDKVRVLCRADYDPEWKWRVAWKDKFQYSSHWRREKTVDIMLPRPADKCYVKFRLYKSSRVSLNGCKIYAHYYRPEPALPAGSVKVTHVWLEDGRARSHTVFPPPAGANYNIVANGSKIANRSIIINVANETSSGGGRP